MKTIRVKDQQGNPVRGWTFSTFTGQQVGAFHGGRQQKPRAIKGWQLIAPDGYTRCCEGNWQQFVPFANMVLENHGYNGGVS